MLQHHRSTYDPTANAIYVYASKKDREKMFKKKVHKTVEIKATVFKDTDKKGKILGYEILLSKEETQ